VKHVEKLSARHEALPPLLAPLPSVASGDALHRISLALEAGVELPQPFPIANDCRKWSALGTSIVGNLPNFTATSGVLKDSLNVGKYLSIC